MKGHGEHWTEKDAREKRDAEVTAAERERILRAIRACMRYTRKDGFEYYVVPADLVRELAGESA